MTAQSSRSVVRSALADAPWLVAIVLVVACGNYAWLTANHVPPHWDQANHMLSALHYRGVLTTCFDSGRGVARAVAHCARTLVHVDQAVYGPLFAFSGGLLSLVTGVSAAALAMTNVPFIALLVASTYGLGRRLHSPLAGVLASMLVCAYPLVFATSREFMLELSLLAFTAAAGYLLVLSNHFGNRPWSLLFGVTAGLAVLTKFTFLPFVVGPLLFEIVLLVADARHGRISGVEVRRRCGTIAASAAVALVVAAVWYLPNRHSFVDSLLSVTSLDTLGESRFSAASLAFYARAMAWDQMGLPLFALFLYGLTRLPFVPVEPRDRLLIWLLSIYGVSTLAVFKAEHNDIGILIPGALVAAIGLASLRRRRGLAIGAVAVFACLQFIVFSAPRPAGVLPRILGWSGAPRALARNEDWKLEEVLRGLAGAPARVLVVSDHPFVNGTTAEFYAVRDQLALSISPCWAVPDLEAPQTLGAFDFVIATTDTAWARPKSDGCFRGPSGRADYEALLARARLSENLRLVQSPSLPDGASLLVFRSVPAPGHRVANAG